MESTESEMFRTKALSYAILMASEVAGTDGRARAAELAGKYELPSTNVAKIMSQLAKVRVLQADSGGYSLARPANKITLLEIFEAINGG